MPQDRQYKTIYNCIKCVKNDNLLLQKIIKSITSTPLIGNHAPNITKLNKNLMDFLKYLPVIVLKFLAPVRFSCGKPHPSAGDNKA